MTDQQHAERIERALMSLKDATFVSGLTADNTEAYIEAVQALASPEPSPAAAEAGRRIAVLEAALTELRGYAASVWFDEASASDEERGLMCRARAALSGTGSEDGWQPIDTAPEGHAHD